MTDATTTGIATPGKCEWCGMIHGAKCPLVKAIEYEHGMVKRVEFFAPNDYAMPPLAGAQMPHGPHGPGFPLAGWGATANDGRELELSVRNTTLAA